MGSSGKRKAVLVCLSLAVVLATAGLVLSGAIAGARTAKRVKSETLLSLTAGSFEISIGSPPSWLPLANTSETLTLIGGAPKKATSDNAYVGFTKSTANCAAIPKKAKGSVYELSDFYSSAHAASASTAGFAPNGGAARGTYIDSVSGVRFTETPSVKACVWLATAKAAASKHASKSLVASIVMPVLNTTFAASVSNLGGATAGSGGYTMYAFNGGRPFTYKVTTTQCARISTDNPTTVSPGTPASETVSISASPCGGDASVFKFGGSNTKNASLDYLVADALTSPPTTLSTGACELDPLTGVSVTTAEAYLSTVGCKVALVEVSPYVKTLPRGDVSWVSIDGGIADAAPKGTAVDLVVNG